jgi:hypothetical protein
MLPPGFHRQIVGGGVYCGPVTIYTARPMTSKDRRYRRRDHSDQPENSHRNVQLDIVWTFDLRNGH